LESAGEENSKDGAFENGRERGVVSAVERDTAATLGICAKCSHGRRDREGLKGSTEVLSNDKTRNARDCIT